MSSGCQRDGEHRGTPTPGRKQERQSQRYEKTEQKPTWQHAPPGRAPARRHWDALQASDQSSRDPWPRESTRPCLQPKGPVRPPDLHARSIISLHERLTGRTRTGPSTPRHRPRRAPSPAPGLQAATPCVYGQGPCRSLHAGFLIRTHGPALCFFHVTCPGAPSRGTELPRV